MATDLTQLQQIERAALTIPCQAEERMVIASLVTGLREYRSAVSELLGARYSDGEVDGATMTSFKGKIEGIENQEDE